MARKSSSRKEPLYWTEVRSGDGLLLLGSFAIDGRMIIVRHIDGWEKKTAKSAGGADEALARIILSEPPPPSFRR